ncbi:MAG: ATP-binding protein [Clostridiales bacterium]|jgi:sensor histidine kinase regulating citrate/malate metabolism|nr:ATP-binding protein [Clostridiales bacterium]
MIPLALIEAAAIAALLAWRLPEGVYFMILMPLAVAAFLMLDAGLIFSALYSVKAKKAELSIKGLLDQIGARENYYKSIEEAVIEARKIKHDHLNFVITIGTLLSSGDIANAEKLLEQYSGKVTEVKMPGYCKNHIVNSILSSKVSAAKELGIACDFEVFIEKDNLPMEELDLVRIFGNLLDNSIRACDSISDPDLRTILLRSKINGQYLLIRTKNPKPAELLFSQTQKTFLTTKQKPEEHGFGISIIRDLAEKKYNGSVDILADDLYFQVTVTLLLDWGDSDDDDGFSDELKELLRVGRLDNESEEEFDDEAHGAGKGDAGSAGRNISHT